MAVEEAKWYVIHTYSGYEAMVKDSLEKLIENNNLQNNIFDIKIGFYVNEKLPLREVFHFVGKEY